MEWSRIQAWKGRPGAGSAVAEERGPARRQALPVDWLCSPADASWPEGKAPFPWHSCLKHERWVPRVPGASMLGGKSLTTWVQVATISRLDEGSNMLIGPSASFLALFPSIFYWVPELFKDTSSHITLLPQVLQLHLEKWKPRVSGV